MTALTDRERTEVNQVLERIQESLEQLCVRGLRAAGAPQIAALEALGEELSGIGASTLASCVEDLVEAIRAGDPRGGQALMRAAVTARVFERALSLEQARFPLELWRDAEC